MGGHAKAHASFDLLDELSALLGTHVDLVMAGAVKNRNIARDIERIKRKLSAAQRRCAPGRHRRARTQERRLSQPARTRACRRRRRRRMPPSRAAAAVAVMAGLEPATPCRPDRPAHPLQRYTCLGGRDGVNRAKDVPRRALKKQPGERACFMGPPGVSAITTRPPCGGRSSAV